MAEEENKIPASTPEAKEAPAKKPGYEPHGSQGAPRPGDRKFGNHRGKPSERRGGRGGFRGKPEDDYLERVVAINRISKTVQGGKHVRFSALVVVGDGKGRYGFALAKSSEVPDAIKKALTKAKKTMYTVEIAKGGTLAHDIAGEYGSTKVVLKAARPGTGIVAGGAVRAILELSGVTNVVSKVYGSRTAVNVIYATHEALQAMKRYDEVMVLRGLKTPEEIKAHKVNEGHKAPEGGK